MPHPEDAIRAAVAALVAERGQVAVAADLGVTQSTVSRFLGGRRRLTLALAVRLRRTYPELRGLVHELVDAGLPTEEAACAAS